MLPSYPCLYLFLFLAQTNKQKAYQNNRWVHKTQEQPNVVGGKFGKQKAW